MPFNQLTLLGNITRDIELRYLQNGTAVCDVGIAVNETWKDAQGNKKEDVLFLDCTCWGKTAELVEKWFSKGQPIMFVGKLKMERWEKDGVKHIKHKMTVDKVVFLPRQDKQPQGDQQDQRYDRSEAQTETDSDLPF